MSIKLPKEYQILNLKLCLNKELYEEKIIPFYLFDNMQKLLLKRMNNIILNYKKMEE